MSGVDVAARRPRVRRRDVGPRPRRMRRNASGWTTFALVAAAILPAAAAQASAGTARALLESLGLDAAQQLRVLESGELVHSGIAGAERLAEEVAAVGALVLIDTTDLSAILDAFVATETFEQIHDIARRSLQPATASGPAGGIRIPDGVIAAILPRLDTNLPGRLNLSSDEARALSRSSSPDAVIAVYRDVLARRYDAFLGGGIRNIDAYRRDRGRAVEPAREIDSAITSLAALDQLIPGFTAELRRGGAPSLEGSHRSHHWIDARFLDMPVLGLASELRVVRESQSAVADLHYYASGGYNSMLTVAGAFPYGQRSLVYVVNHTFTDEVLGFGSSIKRAVARGKIAQRLARHLEAVRVRLAARSARAGK